MRLGLIVALSENNVIGVDDQLPWRLSADLQRFKQLTMGHHLIMGRKTFESIGRLLPGRTTVIVSRQPQYQRPGAVVVNRVQAALDAVRHDPFPFVIGGSEIYAAFLPQVTDIYLTRIHARVNGNAFFPEIDWSQWALTASEPHFADEKNEFDWSFEVFRRQNVDQTARNRD